MFGVLDVVCFVSYTVRMSSCVVCVSCLGSLWLLLMSFMLLIYSMHIFFWLSLFVCVDAYAVLQACVRVYVFLLFCCLVHRFSYVLALLTHSGFSLGPVNKENHMGRETFLV